MVVIRFISIMMKILHKNVVVMMVMVMVTRSISRDLLRYHDTYPWYKPSITSDVYIYLHENI